MMIDLPCYIDSKAARVYAENEDGYIHVSWDTKDGKIIAFEYIPDNYPAVSCKIFKNSKEYRGNIFNIDWIQDSLDDESPDKFDFRVGDTVKVKDKFYNRKIGSVVDIQYNNDTENIIISVDLGRYIGKIKTTEEMLEKFEKEEKEIR